MTCRRNARPAFTLVELLVVMGLMVVLAGLAVLAAESGAYGSQKVVSASDRVSGWLLIAKQRAVRDGRPRGVRFLLQRPDQMTPSYPQPTAGTSPDTDAERTRYVRECQYIEAPDAFVPNRTNEATGPQLIVSVQTNTATPPAVTSRRAFFVTNRTTAAANQADVDSFDQQVQANDYLQYGGATYRITGVSNAGSVTADTSTTPVTYPEAGGAKRQARELLLETFPDFGAANSGPVSAPPTATFRTTTD